MIIITSIMEKEFYLCSDDTFNLTISDALGSTVVISETIKVTKTINFIASYRFALKSGRCPGFHLCGVFGNKKELPEEMQKAKFLEDLTSKQYENFIKSVGIEISSTRQKTKRY